MSYTTEVWENCSIMMYIEIIGSWALTVVKVTVDNPPPYTDQRDAASLIIPCDAQNVTHKMWRTVETPEE